MDTRLEVKKLLKTMFVNITTTDIFLNLLLTKKYVQAFLSWGLYQKIIFVEIQEIIVVYKPTQKNFKEYIKSISEKVLRMHLN